MKHQCPSCGTEYEGNFCPNCGLQWREEKTCPKCGATISGGAKFCNHCGYAFTAAASPAASPAAKGKVQGNATVKKLYSILPRLPALLFLILSLSLFLFYLAPVAITPSILGEPPMSFGNVYQCLKGITLSLGGGLGGGLGDGIGGSFGGGISGSFGGDGGGLDITVDSPAQLQWAMISLLIIAVVMSVFGLFWAIAEGRNKKYYFLCDLIGGAIWLALLILSSIVIAEIAKFDEGLGLVKAGAAIELILSFSIIYLVLEAATIVAVRVMPAHIGYLKPAAYAGLPKNFPVAFYRGLSRLPAVFFAAFSLSLFFFYIAPTASLSGVMDCGSVYALVKDQSASPLMDGAAARNLSLTLISLAIIMTLFSAAWLHEKFAVKASARVNTVFTVLSAPLSLALLITASIFVGQVNANELQAGASVAAPLALSVFSLVLPILGSLLQKLLQNNADVAAEIAAQQRRVKNWHAKYTPPVQKPRPPKPEKPQYDEFGKCLCKVRKLLLVSSPLLFAVLAVCLPVIGYENGTLVSSITSRWSYSHEALGNAALNLSYGFFFYAMILGSVPLTLIFLIASLRSRFGKEHCDIKKGWTVTKIVLSCIFFALALTDIILTGYLFDVSHESNSLWTDPMWWGVLGSALVLLLPIIWNIVLLKQSAQLDFLHYKKPSAFVDYYAQRTEYICAKQAAHEQDTYRYECLCYAQGRAYLQPNKFVLWTVNHSVIAAILLALLAAVFILIAALA